MIKLKDTKIGTRLGIGFGLVLVLLALLIGMSLLRLDNIERANRETVEQDWVRAKAAGSLNASTQQAGRITLEMFLAQDAATMDRARVRVSASEKDAEQSVEVLDALAFMPKGKQLISEVSAELTSYEASANLLGDLLKQGRRDAAEQTLVKKTLPELEALQRVVRVLSEQQNKNVDSGALLVSRNIDAADKLMIAVGLSALLIGVGFSLWVTRSITRPMAEAVRIAQTVAAGNLTSRIEASALNETGELLRALATMNISLIGVVGQVRNGADALALTTAQMATGNADLSVRTAQQAASLAATAAEMQQLTAAVQDNAENAVQANQLAMSASVAAKQGAEAIDRVAETMQGISTSSGKIVEIIGLVEAIAFQTNILALNASVEAARAGQHGLSFAVVASEVRGLAQRSNAAAKEIKTWIESSSMKIDQGSELARQAGHAMAQIGQAVRHMSEIVAEIASASVEQSKGIERINGSVSQMEHVTQQNASLVEEAAAASESMRAQAAVLAHAVNVFRLEG